jgi:carbamate kinase
MKIVLALGGNAIARPGESLSADAQTARVREAAAAVADIARSSDVVVTHGNGPQVGLLALQAQGAPGVGPYPLDVLGAESEGLIGYLLEREFASLFPGSEVATLLTQVEVDPDDPAFAKPTKPIGTGLTGPEADELAQRLGWSFVETEHGFRRVVASPEPVRIRELRTIEILVDAGVLVVCAGGGGIPVIATPLGFRGVEAVIDKDYTASLLARQLHADKLLLLTDVPAVYDDWRGPEQRPLRSVSVETLRRMQLEPGSMGPKVEAACRFVEAGGDARIGALGEARRVLTGAAGTSVRAADGPSEYWPGE